MCCPCCAQILICQNLRNNLQHPNEYIRGSTLRFLCRIREEEILEPLVPSILTNLEHRHSYVRRAAVLAVNSIYKLPKGELLLQDAPETIEKVLRSEQDLSTKRNAFVMLSNHAQDRAAKYLFENIESIATWGDILQMAVLDLIRKASSVQRGWDQQLWSSRELPWVQVAWDGWLGESQGQKKGNVGMTCMLGDSCHCSYLP